MLDGLLYAGLFYKLFIYAAAGLLICIVITTIACLFNNKIKRKSQKENEDAEQK